MSRVPDGQKAYNTTYKVLIIGDTSVGKTALLNRFSDGSFHPSLVSTVGIDNKNKVISLEDEDIKLQIWDTAGQERFRTLTNAYFRGADGALLLYDISKRETYLNVADWMESVHTHATGIQVVIVGHKCDLEDQRSVSREEGEKLAENYNCQFVEVSAKAGINCTKVFIQLAERIKETKEFEAIHGTPKGSEEQISSVTLNPQQLSPQRKGFSGCC